MEIDTLNKFGVGGAAGGFVITRPAFLPMSADDALLLAAYLVAIAEPQATHTFAEVLAAVRST
jgi:hypothetical protein